jgi:hypothetical protein
MRHAQENRKQGALTSRLAHRGRRVRDAALALAIASAAALAVAGCGGSARNTSAQTSTPSAVTSLSLPQAAGPTAATRASASRHPITGSRTETARSKDRVVTGTTVQRPAPGTGGDTPNDDFTKSAASHADVGSKVFGSEPNPCRLVSQSDAESIIGEPIAVPKMLPLGPTCLYQAQGARYPISVSIQAINFSKIKPHMKKLATVRINGHTAYCGKYGQSMTFVPLPGPTVLNVTGPCSVGTLMAAQAISRLSS